MNNRLTIETKHLKLNVEIITDAISHSRLGSLIPEYNSVIDQGLDYLRKLILSFEQEYDEKLGRKL